MLEDDEHDKVIALLQQAWDFLVLAEKKMDEVAHYVTEDAEWKSAIINMIAARRQLEDAIFTSSIDSLGDPNG
jgi:3-hydroxyacyl-CoA dehydrogenase